MNCQGLESQHQPKEAFPLQYLLKWPGIGLEKSQQLGHVHLITQHISQLVQQLTFSNCRNGFSVHHFPESWGMCRWPGWEGIFTSGSQRFVLSYLHFLGTKAQSIWSSTNTHLRAGRFYSKHDIKRVSSAFPPFLFLGFLCFSMKWRVREGIGGLALLIPKRREARYLQSPTASQQYNKLRSTTGK